MPSMPVLNVKLTSINTGWPYLKRSLFQWMENTPAGNGNGSILRQANTNFIAGLNRNRPPYRIARPAGDPAHDYDKYADRLTMLDSIKPEERKIVLSITRVRGGTCAARAGNSLIRSTALRSQDDIVNMVNRNPNVLRGRVVVQEQQVAGLVSPHCRPDSSLRQLKENAQPRGSQQERRLRNGCGLNSISSSEYRYRRQVSSAAADVTQPAAGIEYLRAGLFLPRRQQRQARSTR